MIYIAGFLTPTELSLRAASLARRFTALGGVSSRTGCGEQPIDAGIFHSQTRGALVVL